MKFKDILKNPKHAGKQACEAGLSIHASPFRNTNGYSQEFLLWQKGYQEASQVRINEDQKK